MCSDCLVNGIVKDKIIAHGAAFRKATKSPYGADDEIGMLNLITPESRDAILRNADPTRIYDLSVDNFVGMPGWFSAEDQPYQMWMTHTPRGEVLEDSVKVGRAGNELCSYSGDAISMYTHTGTHIDTLNHFGYNGVIFNGFSADRHLGSRSWTKAGSDKHPPIIARGIMLDVARLHGVDVLPPSYGIGSDDLKGCLKHQGVQLRVGDVVLFRTGRMKYWPNRDLYLLDPPGITREGAEFLALGGAAMIGADNHSLEQAPSADPENWQVVHTYLLAEAGVPLLEIANLEQLSEERIYEFCFFGACIKLRGSTGAPIRPIAMPLLRN
ncbi:cyclase [Ensifer sp. Root31]|uniref:cyclase family protein n=1 Tax=Ensifer sp. Root31 TaxID=1736512 RepID=UPI00070F860E|nr:cyclase family protein [Ensifer sp. Root31]KQU85640.1 cyclase [Ensifer sp. Root31]